MRISICKKYHFAFKIPTKAWKWLISKLNRAISNIIYFKFNGHHVSSTKSVEYGGFFGFGVFYFGIFAEWTRIKKLKIVSINQNTILDITFTVFKYQKTILGHQIDTPYYGKKVVTFLVKTPYDDMSHSKWAIIYCCQPNTSLLPSYLRSLEG